MATLQAVPWPTTADTPPGVWVAETRLVPPTPYPIHRHTIREITWVVGGTGRLWFRGKTHPLGRGSLFTIPPGKPHQILPSDRDPIHRYTVFFKEQNLPEPIRKEVAVFDLEMKDCGPRRHGTKNPSILAQLRHMMELQQSPSGDHTRRIGCLCLIVSELLGSPDTNSTEPENPRLRSLNGWLVQNRSRVFEDDAASRGARELGVSVRQWNRLFRSLTGTSFDHWRLMLRLNEVDRLMSEGAPAVRAAEMAGFETIPHFFRIYRKYRGHTPGQFAVA